MYEQFFGLKEKPFSLTPDTDFFLPLPWPSGSSQCPADCVAQW